MYCGLRRSCRVVTDVKGGRDRAVAFAPASIGNVAVGFDVLGLAIEGVGDVVVARRISQPGVVIEALTATPLASSALELSTDADGNTAGIAALELVNDLEPEFGVALHLHKGIPLGSGMGSSAASAVAAAVAVNALMPEPLPLPSLLGAAMVGEAFASKAYHADNVAPSLLGGLVACPAARLPHVDRLRLPDDIATVLVHPELTVETSASRAALGQAIPLSVAVEQTGLLAAFLCACAANDAAALTGVVRDVMIEPQRKSAVPGFDAVRTAAIDAGAAGASLSGSGPSVFALAPVDTASAVRRAMLAAFVAQGIAADAWVCQGSAPGARLLAPSEEPTECR